MQQEQYDTVKTMMDRWAEWVQTGEPIAEGAPRQCLGAPDARIQSFEDMEIEMNKLTVRAVQAAVWELPILQRDVVRLHYGLITHLVWRAQNESLFDIAVESIFLALKSKFSI